MVAMNKNYYKVKCKCGHVGRDCYIPIDFPVIANNAKEAAQIARFSPRCKHHHKDCILDVIKITYDEFVAINKSNNDDPYLMCKSIQEQREIDISDRVVSENYKTIKCRTKTSKHNVYQGKTKIKNPKKYIRLNYFPDINSCRSECYL